MDSPVPAVHKKPALNLLFCASVADLPASHDSPIVAATIRGVRVEPDRPVKKGR